MVLKCRAEIGSRTLVAVFLHVVENSAIFHRQRRKMLLKLKQDECNILTKCIVVYKNSTILTNDREITKYNQILWKI